MRAHALALMRGFIGFQEHVSFPKLPVNIPITFSFSVFGHPVLNPKLVMLPEVAVVLNLSL